MNTFSTTFTVYFGHDVSVLPPRRFETDLRKAIGTRPIHRDESGRWFFDFPEPFADLRVFDHEHITAEKLRRLMTAFEYFEAVGASDPESPYADQ